MCVMDLPALRMPHAIYAVKFLNSFSRPCYSFAQNVISSSVGGSDCLLEISAKCVKRLCEVKEMLMLAPDYGTHT